MSEQLVVEGHQSPSYHSLHPIRWWRRRLDLQESKDSSRKESTTVGSIVDRYRER